MATLSQFPPQPGPAISPDESAVINVRIQGSGEAVKRARIAFLVSTIASLAILITEWNAYLSWYRHFPLNTEFPANDVTKEAWKYVLQQFAESRVMTVSLLGVRVGVSDMAVLGSMTLLVCSIWLFFSIRRHNHSVGSLLRDTKNSPAIVRRLVYYGVSASLVFTTITAYDSAISDLEDEKYAREARLTRLVVRILFYLPPIVIALTILADILSVYVFQAALSYPHIPLGFGALRRSYKIQFVTMECLAVAIGVPTFYLCRKIILFEESTAQVLREYVKLLG